MINTTEFEFAHGKKPRGRGCWIFFADDMNPDDLQPNAPSEEFHVEILDLYADAAQKAQGWARRGNLENLRLGS